jgi:excisionase family DNA binding protein
MNAHTLTLTRTKAAEMIGVSTKTVDRLCARGELLAARLGGRVLLHRQGVIDYLDRLFNLAPPVEPADGVADARNSAVDPTVPELEQLREERWRRQADEPGELGRAA